MKIKQVMSAAVLAAVLAALTGCPYVTETIAAKEDPQQSYPQVRFESRWMQTWAYVQKPIVQRVGSGQLDVAVPIHNTNDFELIVDYQYRFLRGGMEVEQKSGWHNLRIPRKGVAEIRFSSMTAQADDFDVEIRYRK